MTNSDRHNDHLQQQAWNYFELHAQQRLTTLNFYLLLASAFTAAIVATYDTDFRFPGLRLPAGILLALLSFIFWRLDLRNRHLIKSAEAALREFEGHAAENESQRSAKYLFSREYQEEATRKKRHLASRLLWPTSYSEAFELLFVLFGLMGLFGAVSIAF